MNKFCFAMVLTKPVFEIGVGRLYQSLKYFGSQYDCKILVTDNVDISRLHFLNSNSIPYSIVDYLTLKNPKQLNNAEYYDDTLSKFNILTLTDYDYVCFLDADILITGNIDYLFSLVDTNYIFNLFSRNSIHSQNFVGEIFFVKPSLEIFNEIKSQYNFNKSLFIHDEGFLSYIVRNNIYKCNIINQDYNTYSNIYHMQGYIKFWEIFREGDLLYEWFYNYSIDEFIVFLKNNINKFCEFTRSSSNILLLLYKCYYKLLNNIM